MVTPALTSVHQDGALRAAIALEKLQAMSDAEFAELELFPDFDQ